MKKEILFAILAGALFGLVIAFGIWKANSSMKTDNKISDEAKSEETTLVDGTTSQFGITIAKPESHDVLTSSPVIISGLTKENSWLVISAEDEDYIIKTNPDGSFEQDVDLIAGVNEIVLTVFDDEGNSTKETIILVYSTEFDNPVSDADTEDEDSIEEEG
jgi:hypothetical protein